MRLSKNVRLLIGASLLAVMGGTYVLGQGAGTALITTLGGSDLITVTTNSNPTLNQAITAANAANYFESALSPITDTAVSANALAVGPAGTTNPTFNVDTSVSMAITGLNIQGQASGSGITVTALGGTNEPIFLAGKGTGAVDIGGTTTTLAGLQVAQPASRVNGVLVTPGATGVLATIASNTAGADANVGLSVGASGTGSLYLGGINGGTAGNSPLSVAHGTTNANSVVVTGTNTGSVPTITSTGDSNIGLAIAGSGTGNVLIGGTTTTLAGLQVAQTASAVNDIVITNAATGVIPTIKLGGATADANRNLSIAANGTGIVALGQTIATCSAADTATATCNGQRFVATFTAVTITSDTVKTETISNSSVVATSVVLCTLQSFTGTITTNGIPYVEAALPGSSTITLTLANSGANTTGSQSFVTQCAVF